MRRYTLTVNDSTKVIDVEAVGANLFRVQIDGRLIDVTLDDHRDLARTAVTPAIMPRPAPTLGAAPGAAAPVSASAAPAAAPAGAAAGESQAAPSSTPVQGAPAVRATGTGGGGAGLDKMTAPMPGVIVTIEKNAGASVKRGETVLLLEAMKMKNELKAPRDGNIAEVYVSVGQQVKYGEILVRFEGN
ncbi:MAG TPA: biotin/lipoyl-containing protein [Candidatus Limnocylindrales bacterium]